MGSLNQKSAGRLLYPVAGGKIPVRDLMTDEGQRTYIDFGQYDYITLNALSGYNPALPVVDHLVEIGDPDVYTLSAPELVMINTYNRYPNFVAIVMASGQAFSDIQPIYVGSIGAFTAISVQVHGDGSGVAFEATTVQFS